MEEVNQENQNQVSSAHSAHRQVPVQPPNYGGTGQMQMNQIPRLRPEEYESLKRSIQLLRIEQLRYIVQKFRLPANGNKTKLLKLVLQYLEQLRTTPLLVQINAEVINLISQQHEPFTNPIEAMKRLTICSPEQVIRPPDHPFIDYTDSRIVFGPIASQPGPSNGSFTFNIQPTNNSIIMDFSWYKNEKTPFDMNATINGYEINCYSEDISPQPIDITSYVNSTTMGNRLEINTIRTAAPMLITIREVRILTVYDLADRLIGSQTTNSSSKIMAKGPECLHSAGFSLYQYLSKSISLQNWNCPICGNALSPNNLVLIPDSPDHDKPID